MHIEHVIDLIWNLVYDRCVLLDVWELQNWRLLRIDSPEWWGKAFFQIQSLGKV